MFIKICGITNEEDALLAVAMGADAVGFIFAPSPRQIAPSKVREIVRRLPSEILTVGVFRDEHPIRINEIMKTSRVQGVQLHGHETPQATFEIVKSARFVIKAVVAGSDDARRAYEFNTDVILVDGVSPGSGQVLDWSLLSELPDTVLVMLSGGLKPENVGDGIRLVKPWGVDVCSGVEKSPGHKDPLKLRRFIAEARAADQTPPQAPYDPSKQPYDWAQDE